MNRRGFALLAVLWTIAALSVLVLAATMAARQAVGETRNRIASTRSRWIAEGCAERARSRIDRAMATTTAWHDSMPHVEFTELRASGCDIALAPAGILLDVNEASGERLHRLFAAIGMNAASADSLTDAILDWRDADDIARPLGAERDWYGQHGEVLPRNGPFADPAELRVVRGFPTGGLISFLSAEPGKTPLNLAPLAVVASLPGMTAEVVDALAERRRRAEPLHSLSELVDGLSVTARDTLLPRFAELAEQATVDPSEWILVVRVRVGTPSIESTVRLELAPAEHRAAIVSRQIW